MKTGVMLVGINGVNASVLISGCLAMQLKEVPKQYGITESDFFRQLSLIDVDDMVFGGWDYYTVNQYALLKEYGIAKFVPSKNLEMKLAEIQPMKGVHTSKDIVVQDRFDNFLTPGNIKEGVDIVKNDIQNFKTYHSLDIVIVIYLGSPSKKINDDIKGFAFNEILEQEICKIPSGLLYAIASITTGAHFIDFTPSETLEFGFLNSLSETHSVQLSGRDGSTGQTMLKLTLANMLLIRNLRLKAWYSTNIIGNHDGYILSNPEYNETKIKDKKYGLEYLLGYNDFEHKVTIDFFKARFDSKESWDSVDFSGWLNTPMCMKINWQGEDAILSAPLLLDIIRLIAFGATRGLRGFQKQLGLFYKHPFGCEGMSLESMYKSMLQFYLSLEG